MGLCNVLYVGKEKVFLLLGLGLDGGRRQGSFEKEETGKLYLKENFSGICVR